MQIFLIIPESSWEQPAGGSRWPEDANQSLIKPENEMRWTLWLWVCQGQSEGEEREAKKKLWTQQWEWNAFLLCFTFRKRASSQSFTGQNITPGCGQQKLIDVRVRVRRKTWVAMALENRKRFGAEPAKYEKHHFSSGYLLHFKPLSNKVSRFSNH